MGFYTWTESSESGYVGIPELSLSLSLFFATLIALALIFSLTFFFFWEPMKEHLIKREENINTNIDEAFNKNKEADEILIRSKETEQASRAKAKEIVNESKKEAVVVKNEIIDDSKKKSESMINKSREQIQKEKDSMSDDIRKEILETSILAAEKIIEKELDKDANERMINELIESIK